ncbi:ABC transporter ATP-binding protein [Nocardiopsis gilva YIM 90087]|uniref:ABC transporter ATP-binding protein n=1 Tax=Nocardiopsis gilva YIM 90087 TaxID=1235441 RepID=A0A223S285_9ACTN|nr:dipeptide/oligopeptide/nickel ABC transporter ATP-binding protein [Nocardiopsis gilva]ASU82129.1 ABC transporter ATP-binding protein [Nocardiopsis gilva YIM 90087]
MTPSDQVSHDRGDDQTARAGGRGAPLISCRGVGRTLGGRRRRVAALRGVDLEIAAGESVAVVGRSGSGKSTLVGVLTGLDRPQSGTLGIGGVADVWSVPERERRVVRRRFGWIPQDALTSFDPRYAAGDVVAEALPGAADVDTASAVAALFERVGLAPELMTRRPATLSGGERQRVAVARALAVDPDVLVADEPTSGLDVVTQERVLDVIAAQRRIGAGADRRDRTLILVTHDLRIARRMADRVVVLDGGGVAADVPVAALDTGGSALRRLVEATPAL